MTRIYTTTVIRKPHVEVFDYVTTPANWPKWHPSSIAVRGATDHSLEPTEELTEEFQVAGRRGTVVWKVIERDAPYRWVIEGKVSGGGKGTIAYSVKAHPGGTIFEREFIYQMPNFVFELLNWLIFKRRIKAESVKALSQLKAVLES
jgi:uncharacterized protein YndB with AHSA1/START domain